MFEVIGPSDLSLSSVLSCSSMSVIPEVSQTVLQPLVLMSAPDMVQ
jgi:hypothetical protein